MSSPSTLGTVVILTALPLEQRAVLVHLSEVHEEIHPQGTVYKVGDFSTLQGSWHVAVAQIGQGNARASMETERAISFYNPKYVFFVGVAGGLKDVQLGDVVAATKVYYYEMGKSEEEFKQRPDFGQPAYSLVQRAQAVVSDTRWQERIPNLVGTDTRQVDPIPSAFLGPIVAGEKVLASINSQHYQFVRRNFSDALAVEMEGFGFLLANNANYPTRALVVRGISDMVDKKEEADAAGSQPRAVRNAAAFAFEVLVGLSAGMAHSPMLPDEIWNRLREIATELYPKGPEDRGLWQRADGDIASLALGSTGRATWFAALKELRLGGGGAISVEKLLAAMREDYPNSQVLAQFSEQVAFL